MSNDLVTGRSERAREASALATRPNRRRPVSLE
jgi:hypothetical protein